MQGVCSWCSVESWRQDWRFGSGKTDRVRSIFLEQMFILKSHKPFPFEILLVTLTYHSFVALFLVKSFFKQQHEFAN